MSVHKLSCRVRRPVHGRLVKLSPYLTQRLYHSSLHRTISTLSIVNRHSSQRLLPPLTQDIYRRLFTTDNNNNNNNNDNNDTNNSNTDNIEKPSPEDAPPVIYPTPSEPMILAESRNQKSLVRSKNGKKSVVPYIGDVMVLPIQKPLFPGFSSVLYITDEELKTYLINQYRKHIDSIANSSSSLTKFEWMGLFLHNPQQSTNTTVEETDTDTSTATDQPNTDAKPTVGATTSDDYIPESDFDDIDSPAFELSLDDINCDLLHRVPKMVRSFDELFGTGTLVKIDWNDPNTNIQQFLDLEEVKPFTSDEKESTGDTEATTAAATTTKDADSLADDEHTASAGVVDAQIESEADIDTKVDANADVDGDAEANVDTTTTEAIEDESALPNVSGMRKRAQQHAKRRMQRRQANRRSIHNVESFDDPLYLKIIGARRIQLDSVAKYRPLFGNIKHLEPTMLPNDTTTALETLSEDEAKKVEHAHDIKWRAQFSVAAELLRSILRDDPDNREEMMNLWRVRHQIDIGFFADFAASLTNSTPRELQRMLECVDYETRLSELVRLLKREEQMIDTREEIIKDVDAMIKKENTQKHLEMILSATMRRLFASAPPGSHPNAGEGGPGKPVGGGGAFVMGGGTDDKAANRYQRLAQRYLDRVQLKTMHPDAKEAFEEGIDKLMSAKQAQSSMDLETTKQYLDWLSGLPWDTYTVDNSDIAMAKQVLDDDHYGMADVKDRILEIIAMNIMRGNADGQGKILCLVGPPGVGKTSIGSSIAHALNKKFFKFSLGGSDDSHVLKGFLRTYVGSNPGKLIYALKQTQASNPMILIDEIDKMGARHSDPSHALLEILDPSQNHEFTDNYLDVAVDLSKVLFVCTANDESRINPTLLDRLQVVRLAGYDYKEKLAIAKKYLIPKSLKHAGLTVDNLDISDDVIAELIRWYCRESGVRSLEQHIHRICAKAAYELANRGVTHAQLHGKPEPLATSEGEIEEISEAELSNMEQDSSTTEQTTATEEKPKGILKTFSTLVEKLTHKTEPPSSSTESLEKDISSDASASATATATDENIRVIVTVDDLQSFVGPRRFTTDRTYEDEKSTPSGVVTGLAYNNYGGSTNYIETVKYRTEEGKGGSVKCTGQLGKVMSESVEIATIVARQLLYNRIDANNEFFNDTHIHLHSPEGAISKDGPSAGVTITTALLSLALDVPVSPNLAMTGEVTLTGKILKIGGMKEKLLASKRAHIDTLIFPFENRDEFFDDRVIPPYLRDFRDVHFVKHYNEVLDIVFPNIQTVAKREIRDSRSSDDSRLNLNTV